MEAVSYTSSRGLYTKRKCTIEDIDEHLMMVKNELEQHNEELGDEYLYTQRMILAILQDTAHYVVKDGKTVGLLYYVRETGTVPNVEASALIADDMIASIILLMGMTLSKWKTMYVAPHGRNFVKFKSLATKESIRMYNNGKSTHVHIKKTPRVTRMLLKLARCFNIRKVR